MANVYMGTDVEDFIFGESTYEEACGKGSCKKENTDVNDISFDYESDEDGKISAQFKEEVEAELNACGVMECVDDDPEVACYRIALENEQNYNMVINAFMQNEISVMESTGSEIVYEAADVKKFFSAVQAVINKFWQKIQGVFKTVVQKLRVAMTNNKRFVKKYKGERLVKPTTEYELKGYNFSDVISNNKAYMGYSQVADEIGKYIRPYIGYVDNSMSKTDTNEFEQSFKEEFNGLKGKLRSYLCGGKAVKEEEFNKSLKTYFYGSAEPVQIKSIPEFAEVVAELEQAKNSMKGANNLYKMGKSSVATLKKDIKDAESNLGKSKNKSNAMKIARILSNAANTSVTLMSQALSAHTGALLAYNSQMRKIAAWYVSNQPKNLVKSSNESAIERELGITLI